MGSSLNICALCGFPVGIGLGEISSSNMKMKGVLVRWLNRGWMDGGLREKKKAFLLD